MEVRQSNDTKLCRGICSTEVGCFIALVFPSVCDVDLWQCTDVVLLKLLLVLSIQILDCICVYIYFYTSYTDTFLTSTFMRERTEHPKKSR